jgi:hypothetical protein
LVDVRIFARSRDGLAYVGLVFSCSQWDHGYEHGAGIVVHGDRLIRFGVAEVAQEEDEALIDLGLTDRYTGARSRLVSPWRRAHHHPRREEDRMAKTKAAARAKPSIRAKSPTAAQKLAGEAGRVEAAIRTRLRGSGRDGSSGSGGSRPPRRAGTTHVRFEIFDACSGLSVWVYAVGAEGGADATTRSRLHERPAVPRVRRDPWASYGGRSAAGPNR